MASDTNRHTAVIHALVESNLHAIVCCSPTSVLLLSGYWPVLGVSVVVFSEEGRVIVILPEDEMEIAQETTDVTIIGYKPTSLDRLTEPIDAITKPLQHVMESLRLSGKTVGVEFNQAMQPASYASSATFQTSLLDRLGDLQPEAKYVSCDSLLGSLKMIKTPQELSLIRKAANIAADGFEEAARQIRVGMRETDVAAAAHSAFSTSTKATGIERSYGFFYCMSGPNSAKAFGAYARTRQRKIEAHDLVMLHANTCADGYWTDITRTYAAGELTERQQAMRIAIEEARKAALEAVRPTAAASDVDRAARRVMTAHGFGDAFKHSTGHGVGFAAANANGMPRIHPESPDILQEGMTFNIEPACYFKDYGGMRHCDIVAVSHDRATVLTDF